MGKVFKYGDDVSTDDIIAGKYKFLTTDMKKLSEHAMENIDPSFSQNARQGDYVVAGRNFGCGSSREQAPLVLKAAGIQAVVAKSFARIFYRNAINVGLPVVECPEAAEKAEKGDEMSVDLEKGAVVLRGESFEFKPLPGFLRELLRDGGVVAQYKKHKKFKWAQK